MKAQVDQLLTDVAIGYKPKGFLAEILFPYKGVKQYTGLIGKYGKGHLRIVNSVSGGRGKYRQVETRVVSTDAYNIESHGLTDIVTKRDYANVVDPFNAERDATMGIEMVLQLEKEKSLVDALSSTSVMTQNTTLSGTSQLSDYTNSDPLGVFKTAQTAVLDGCGSKANVAWMDEKVAMVLRYHPAILDKLGYKYNRAGQLTNDELARAMDVERVLIADVAYNTAKQGQADSMARMWGKHLWFGCIPANLEVMMTTLGMRFGIEGQQPRQVYKQPLFNPPGANEILVEDEYDYVLNDVLAGYLVKDAIA